MTEPLFPVTNPDVTGGPGRLPRRVDAFLQLLIDEFMQIPGPGSIERCTLTDTERVHLNCRQVDLFSQAFLLAAIREGTTDANVVTAALADQLDAGEVAEWMHHWRDELEDGQPLTLPFPTTRPPSKPAE